MTESTKIDYVSIVQDLRDEADLCRNETATDIADLLDDAASCIVAMKSQFTALRSDLAAAQEARQRAEEKLRSWEYSAKYDDVHYKALEERAQRAEALAESYRKALIHERTALSIVRDRQCHEGVCTVSLADIEKGIALLDAVIDAAREGK